MKRLLFVIVCATIFVASGSACTNFIVTKGLDGCLFVYSKTEWTNLEEKLKTLPFTSKDARAFNRFLFAGAEKGKMPLSRKIIINKDLILIIIM